MGKSIYLLIIGIIVLLSGCNNTKSNFKITESTIMDALSIIETDDRELTEKRVRQVARLWRAEDGDESDFKTFCTENFITDPAEKQAIFERVSFYMEGIEGHFNQMSLHLRHNTDLDTGPLYSIDEAFAAFSPAAHLSDDLYRNKIAFIVALNFPRITLEEKEMLGNDRHAWAYARMGDLFTERIPADVQQKMTEIESESDIYIAKYNIYMGKLLTEDGRRIFPEDMVLLSHWNLRDEIKSNYNMGEPGLEKQRMVYQVMKRIISQEIPSGIVNSPDYYWDPYSNNVTKSDATNVVMAPENNVRYQKLLDNFHAMQGIDKYAGNTYIDRKFNDEMEISLDTTEALFDSYLSSPEMKQVGELIAGRVGRNLEAYDIWYDGFKARSNLDENKLTDHTTKLYPNEMAFEKAIPSILAKLGWMPQQAQYIGEKIAVDAARGSGHAWGSAMKGQKSHLRTRLTNNGMDYKGYNIAIHELGHNVEQTISMYDVDNYMMSGVPNTAFTEALAFIFQKRDLEVLGITESNTESQSLDVLDKTWSLYEVCGVSMLDIAVWKWMYANPDATAEQLRDQTITLSKEIWNKYFAPVFGIEDQTILAVYSHMITNPLYLSAYGFGHIIGFQLEKYLEGRYFAEEVDRIYKLGRLTPNAWMIEATGNPLSVEPMLSALRDVLEKQ